MEAVPWIIPLLSICLLHGGADSTDIPVYPDLDVQKLAGTWYSIAFVLKNHEPLDIISIDDVVEPSEEGDLFHTLRYIHEGTCQEAKVHTAHTGRPGIFVVPETGEIVHIVDVDYERYIIMHNGVDDNYSLYLLSRTREASEDVKAKFRTLAETLGFNVNQVRDTRLAGEAFCSLVTGTEYHRSVDNYGVLFAGPNPTSCYGDRISFLPQIHAHSIPEYRVVCKQDSNLLSFTSCFPGFFELHFLQHLQNPRNTGTKAGKIVGLFTNLDTKGNQKLEECLRNTQPALLASRSPRGPSLQPATSSEPISITGGLASAK